MRTRIGTLGTWYVQRLRKLCARGIVKIVNGRYFLSELYYKIKGERKLGTYETIDDRDIKAVTAELLDLSDVDGIDADNIWNIGQGKTTQCVPHQVAFALSSLATRIFQERITFQPEYIKKLMVDRGWYKEGRGAIIRNGMKAVKNECKEKGFITDAKGEKFFVPAYVFVNKGDDWREALNKRYYIVTGLFVKHPMCTPKWFYIPQKRGGGHCVGAFDDARNASRLKTSWNKFGIKQGKTQNGNLWCKHEDEATLMRGWIFPEIKKV